MKKKSHRSGIGILPVALLLICSIGFAVYFGYLTIKDISEHNKAKEEYQTITLDFTKPIETVKTTDLPEETVPLYPVRDIDYASLKSQNKDYIGWLYFPFIGNDEEHSFTVDYPVVYENYRNQYLRTTFDGKHNTGGCIFMDNKSNPSFYGYNDIIYGHHMRDNSMFGNLEIIHQMDDLDYLKDNPQFLYIYTKTACHVYVMVGYEQTDSGNFSYNAAYDNKAYDQIKDYIKSLDTYMNYDCFTWAGRPEILNLSTCDSAVSGGKQRFIVHFVKVMAYEYDEE